MRCCIHAPWRRAGVSGSCTPHDSTSAVWDELCCVMMHCIVASEMSLMINLQHEAVALHTLFRVMPRKVQVHANFPPIYSHASKVGKDGAVQKRHLPVRWHRWIDAGSPLFMHHAKGLHAMAGPLPSDWSQNREVPGSWPT